MPHKSKPMTTAGAVSGIKIRWFIARPPFLRKRSAARPLPPVVRRLAVARLGGHTTASWSTRSHSQITLAARRFQPASPDPGAPNRSPLPLGRLPAGRRMRRAAAATAPGSSDRVAGMTSWNRTHAAENPASAAALISSPYRCS